MLFTLVDTHQNTQEGWFRMDISKRFIKVQFLSLTLFIGLAAVFILLGLLGSTSVVLAKGQELTVAANLESRMQPLLQLSHSVVFTDPAVIKVQDLFGNVGEGIHTGEVRCTGGDNCNKKTQLQFTSSFTDVGVLSYQFKTLQALDPERRRSVVAGTGTIYNNGQRERFLFTATFDDNRDGTIAVTYVASRPDASFMIPRSPGTFWITSRP